MNKLKTLCSMAIIAMSTAHAAELVVHQDRNSGVDQAVKRKMQDTIIQPLNQQFPNNNIVVMVNYHIAADSGNCLYSISVITGIRDKNGRIIVNEKFSPSEIGIGGTIGEPFEKCAAGFENTIERSSANVINQFIQLRSKSI